MFGSSFCSLLTIEKDSTKRIHSHSSRCRPLDTCTTAPWKEYRVGCDCINTSSVSLQTLYYFKLQHIAQECMFCCCSIEWHWGHGYVFDGGVFLRQKSIFVTIHIWISIEFLLYKTIKFPNITRLHLLPRVGVHSFWTALSALEFSVWIFDERTEDEKNPIKCNTVDYRITIFASGREETSCLAEGNKKITAVFFVSSALSDPIHRVLCCCVSYKANWVIFQRKWLCFIHSFGEFALKLVADNELELESPPTSTFLPLSN